MPTARREVMPDDFAMNVTRDIAEVKDGDPNYVPKWFGKDDPEGIAKARDEGWKFGKNTSRRVQMYLPKDEAQRRQQEVWDKSKALLEQRPDDEPEGANDPANEGRKVQNTHQVTKTKIAAKFEDSGD